MKEIEEKINQLRQQAKQAGQKDINVTLTSGGETSLSKVIKTKEQADLFMRILRSYTNS
jgi:hypothetical protein